MKLPKKISVAKVISSRYEGDRPANWDERYAGVDVITTYSGDTMTLVSTGQQSSPKPGWTLMLTAEQPGVGFQWTLYGLPPNPNPGNPNPGHP